MSWFKR